MTKYNIFSDYEKQTKLKEVVKECNRLHKPKYWILKQMGIPKSTYYDWLRMEGKTKSKAPKKVWNKTGKEVEDKIVSIRNNNDLYRSQRSPRGISSILEESNILITSSGVWNVLKRKGLNRKLVKYKKEYIIFPKGEKFLSVVCIDDVMLTNWKPRDMAVFNAIDEYSRMLVSISFVPHRVNKVDVIELIEKIKENYGRYPKKIRLDNAKAHISRKVKLFCKIHKIKLQFIDPGTPQQNWPVETFNGVLRKDVLDNLFWQAKDKQKLLDNYKEYYNKEKRLFSDYIQRTPYEIATAITSKKTQERIKVRLIRKHYGQVEAKKYILKERSVLLPNLSEMCVD